jgi:hypothetical protein
MINEDEILDRLWSAPHPITTEEVPVRVGDCMFDYYYVEECIDVELMDIEYCLN